tara:strand:- start:49 stop:195 length:147 start_codon:yes stop_codon:yes gene_type:complete
MSEETKGSIAMTEIQERKDYATTSRRYYRHYWSSSSNQFSPLIFIRGV